MTAERRYILIVAAIILASAIGIGVIIAISTGDGWRGLEVTAQMIGGAALLMLTLWLVGRASGNH